MFQLDLLRMLLYDASKLWGELSMCLRFLSGTLWFLVFAIVSVNAQVFDRGLPTINLNNDAPQSVSPAEGRRNTNWHYVDSSNSGKIYAVGDDFSIGSSGEIFVVNKIRVWIVAGAEDSPKTLSDFWSSLTLWGGKVGDEPKGVFKIKSGQTGSPDISYIQLPSYPYSNSRYYVSVINVEGFRKLWQVEFTNLNWPVDGGELYQFFVSGDWAVGGDTKISPALHASNATLAGSRQDGSDGFFRVMVILGDSPAFVGTNNSDENGAPGTFTYDCESGKGGWDKSSDINVQIWALPLLVTVDGCPTNVENKLYKGEFISDYVEALAANARPKSRAVKTIKAFTRELVKANVITEQEKNSIDGCAGHFRIR